MRPYPEEVLRAIQGGIMAHFAPEVQSDYGKAQLAFCMMLFGVATREMDSAVPDLRDANRELRGILGDAGKAIAGMTGAGTDAARATLAALPEPDTTLRVSALRKEHEALRAAAGALAPLIEPAADDAELAPLRGVRTALYAHLKADAQKRMVPILS